MFHLSIYCLSTSIFSLSIYHLSLKLTHCLTMPVCCLSGFCWIIIYIYSIFYTVFIFILSMANLCWLFIRTLTLLEKYWISKSFGSNSKSEYQDRYRIWSNILYIVWEDTNISYYVAFTNRAFRPGAGVLTKDRQKIGTGNWIQLREWFWVTTGLFQSLWIDYESGYYLSPKKIFGDFKYCQSCTQRWVMQK